MGLEPLLQHFRKLQPRALETYDEPALRLIPPSAAQPARGMLWVSLNALEAKCVSGKGLMLAALCLRPSHCVAAGVSFTRRSPQQGR